MRPVALSLVVILVIACGGAPTQPSELRANVVQDRGGTGGTLGGTFVLCGGSVGSSSWSCSGTFRLRNIGAGCAQNVQAILNVITRPPERATIGIYHSEVYYQPHQRVMLPSEVIGVPFTFDSPADATYRVDATWTDVPCDR